MLFLMYSRTASMMEVYNPAQFRYKSSFNWDMGRQGSILVLSWLVLGLSGISVPGYPSGNRTGTLVPGFRVIRLQYTPPWDHNPHPLHQPPPTNSTVYSLLAPVAEDFVCAPASQALSGAYFFCVVADAVACCSHLKYAHLKLNQKVLCASGFALWALSSVLVSDSSIRTIYLCAVWKQWLILTFWLMWQHDATVKKG